MNPRLPRITLPAVLVALLAAGSASPAAAFPAAAQSADALYLKALADGEASFAAGRFEDARKDLEIAAFGLGGDPVKQARARAFLGLALYNLKDRTRGTEELGRAAERLGQEGWDRLDLPPAVRKSLDQALAALKIDPLRKAPAPPPLEFRKAAAPAGPPVTFSPAAAAPASAAPTFTPPAAPARDASLRFDRATLPVNLGLEFERPAAGAVPAIDSATLAALERKRRESPADAGAAAALSRAYLRLGRVRDARAALLPAASGEDAETIFARATVDYFARDARAALDGFHRLESPLHSARTTLDRGRRILVYTILCLQLVGLDATRESYLDAVRMKIDPPTLGRILAEEGLVGQWETMMARRKS